MSQIKEALGMTILGSTAVAASLIASTVVTGGIAVGIEYVRQRERGYVNYDDLDDSFKAGTLMGISWPFWLPVWTVKRILGIERYIKYRIREYIMREIGDDVEHNHND